MLPLDLHVLSLSLAFILSQDQTLRCFNCFFNLCGPRFRLTSGLVLDGFHSIILYYLSVLCNYSQRTLFIFAPSFSKRGAKVRTFFLYFQIFSEVFSEPAPAYRLDSPNSPHPRPFLFHYLPGLRPNLPRLRVQKYCFLPSTPNVLRTFLGLFLIHPDNQGNMT